MQAAVADTKKLPGRKGNYLLDTVGKPELQEVGLVQVLEQVLNLTRPHDPEF